MPPWGPILSSLIEAFQRTYGKRQSPAPEPPSRINWMLVPTRQEDAFRSDYPNAIPAASFIRELTRISPEKGEEAAETALRLMRQNPGNLIYVVLNI